MSLSNRARLLLKVLATQGPGWALTRARLAISNRTGTLERRTPLKAWSQLPLSASLEHGIPSETDAYWAWRRQNAPPFFFGEIPVADAVRFVGENSIRAADGILEGEFPFFGATRKLPFPPDWQRNPVSGAVAAGGHWSRVDEFQPGDVKLWWETSRFGWVFVLGRAYTRTRDDRYAEGFWRLVDSWLEQNPPQWGIHWKCGQEATFRVMALCFGLYAFAGSPASTPQRSASLVIALGEHARRINAYIEYALSQKNNHGISEGTGLWTLGLLFPELRGAAGWRARGKAVIESETRRQIAEDGSYVQHSLNYHRVMLHDLGWALRLGERNDNQLSSGVYELFAKSVGFLHAVTDPETGWAPNYGANDGALVLPLTDCAYPDMRPVLESSHFLAHKQRLYPPGPWDEEKVWLNGVASLHAKQEAEASASVDLDAEAGGYFTIHSGDSWLMMRGAKYKDRPSHADQLNVDLWWRGENVFCDAGTYSYNAPAPFDHAFALTRYHNTVTVDGKDQMTRLTRFLWGDWANATARRYQGSGGVSRILEGRHDGYAKAGVVHRRAVSCPWPGAWIVVDDLTGRGEHDARLHWLMPDVPFHMTAPGVLDLECGAGRLRVTVLSNAGYSFDLVRAGERVAGASDDPADPVDPSRGWIARSYARKEPALSLAAATDSMLPVRFITVILLGTMLEVDAAPSFAALTLDSRQIDLSAIGAFPLFIGAQ
jgi:asparagine synthase (glutamine-hydrolysing)